MSSTSKKVADKKRLIKVMVAANEHDRIRLAAAMMRQGVGEFAASVVVQEANRITAKIDFPKN